MYYVQSAGVVFSDTDFKVLKINIKIHSMSFSLYARDFRNHNNTTSVIAVTCIHLRLIKV